MRLQQLSKLTKVQKELKKFGEVELYQTGEGSHMVAVQDAEKRISVSLFKGVMVIIVDYINERYFRYQKATTQKDVVFYINNVDKMEIQKMDEEVTEVKAEKSTVAPLESPVKITPEVTAMNVSRESESARKVAELANQHDAGYWTKILDYGCGLGRNINYLIKNTESICIDGCDTPEQIENLKKDTEKMRFFEKSGSVIATSDRVRSDYDFILNSHVLNVVMDDVKKIIIEDMYELLKKGGKAIIQVRTESDVTSAKTKEKYGDGWLIKKGKDTTYQEGITKEKMHKLLTDAGFKIINHRFTKSIHMVEVVK